jgi:hypothetical protein
VNENDGNIIPHPASIGGPGGSGSGIEARLRAVEAGLIRLETEMKHVATKADLEAMKADLERHFNQLLKWAIGIMIAATGALSAIILGLLRIFGN